MYKLRQANLQDMDELVQCRIDLLFEAGNIEAENNNEMFNSRLEAYLRDNLGTRFLCWVAEKDNKIVAISGLNVFEKPPTFSNLSGLEGYIMNMYVKKEFRGQGIATNLMNTILEYLREIGVKQVKLIATDQGRAVYERLGFSGYTDGMKLNLE